jgi:UDP-glucose 4-epimerase
VKILVTGSSGFVGSAVLKELIRLNEDIKVVVRNSNTVEPTVEKIMVNSIDSSTVWGDRLLGCDVIVHCAARVHIMAENCLDPLSEYRDINTLGTLNLARQAANSGVKRFIFLSSIKVLGEDSSIGHPLVYSDQPKPTDPYGVSKYDAEEGLKILTIEPGMEIVIIRPPLIYGPAVKANFLTMMKWLNRNIPLPLGAIHNKRSLVSLSNLVYLVVTCLAHPSAANQTFLGSDDRDVSTTQLLRLLGNALSKKVLLLPVPVTVIDFMASVIGKKDFSHRLCSSLQVDINHTKTVLNWHPPFSIEESLLATAIDFKHNQKLNNRDKRFS